MSMPSCSKRRDSSFRRTTEAPSIFFRFASPIPHPVNFTAITLHSTL